MNIYQYAEIEKELNELVAENDGEVTPEIMEAITKAHTDTEEKRLRFCHFMRSLELDITAHKLEEERIAEKRKSLESKLKWAKIYITPYVVEHGKQNIGTFTWSLRKSKVVDITHGFDETSKLYNTTKTDVKPNRTAIKEALNSGVEIIGASIVTKQNFQFK
jgi:hypothetical protein